MKRYIIPFSALTMKDVAEVGGKNASLGEMIRNLSPLGVAVPDGFAITVTAFYDFMSFNALSPQIQVALDRLNRLTLDNLSEVGESCRSLILSGIFPVRPKTDIIEAYAQLGKDSGQNLSVAVRSSGTAEDSPTASFAGQHDSFFNVTGEHCFLVARLHEKGFVTEY